MLPVHIFDAIILLYVAVLVAMHRKGRRLRAEVAASRTWPAAPSRVVGSQIHESYTSKGGTTYRPGIAYEYDVDGTRHRSARPYFGEVVGYSWKRNADRDLASFVADAQVQVFYDPADASRAVIQRRAPLLRRYNVLFVVMFALLGVLVVARMYLAGLVDQSGAA